MIEPITAIKTTSTVIGESIRVKEILSKWHMNRAERKFTEFCVCLDTCFERMSEEERQKLKNYISSYEASNVLEEFAETIVSSPSHIARMALALLFCGDNEFYLTEQEKFVFVLALKQSTDETLKFFLDVSDVAVKQRNSNANRPYPVGWISSGNIDDLEWKWDVEKTHIYVNELIRLKMLIPAPISKQSLYSNPIISHWELDFGLGKNSVNMAGIIRKAIVYLE